jgi:hypothetical protein
MRSFDLHFLVRSQVDCSGSRARTNFDLASSFFVNLYFNEALQQRKINLNAIPNPARQTKTPNYFQWLFCAC